MAQRTEPGCPNKTQHVKKIHIMYFIKQYALFVDSALFLSGCNIMESSPAGLEDTSPSAMGVRDKKHQQRLFVLMSGSTNGSITFFCKKYRCNSISC